MQDKLKFPFSLTIRFDDKPSVILLKSFNCKKLGRAWGCAKRWATKQAEENNSLDWEISIGH